MPKFKRKSHPFTAVQYNGLKDHSDQILHWINGGKEPENEWPELTDDNAIKIRSFTIPVNDGLMSVETGEWVIKEIDGSFRPCSPDVFDDLFVEIGEEHEDDSNSLRSATIELEEGMTIVIEPYCYTNIRIRRVRDE